MLYNNKGIIINLVIINGIKFLDKSKKFNYRF